MIVCVRWASALPEGLVKQTCSISTSLWWWCVGFPFICFPFIYIHTCTSVYFHVHTALGHTHTCHVTALESPLSSLCAASHAVTLRHTTHACSCMCVYVLCCSCVSAHTLAAWALCGWRKWRTMMGSLVCLVARVRTCVNVYVCVCESPVFWCTYTQR